MLTVDGKQLFRSLRTAYCVYLFIAVSRLWKLMGSKVPNFSAYAYISVLSQFFSKLVILRDVGD